MSTPVEISLACGDYDIVRPLLDGTVVPEGIRLTILTRMDSATRHWRFLRNREFDMAELSASSFLAAHDRGWPVAAIAVFLHRRFRHGFVFVNTASGIRSPADLIGKRVGTKAFLTTATLWLRGMLEHDYGVPHRSIDWVAELDDDVPFTPPEGLRLSRLPEDRSLEDLLLSGEIAACLHADLIAPIQQGDPRVARLFADPKAAATQWYRDRGIFPIMHVMGIRPEIVAAHPWVPRSMFEAFEEAKRIAMARAVNPRRAPLAFWREDWDEERALLGPDPWEYGLGAANRHNLETLIGYAAEQGIIRTAPAVESLFVDLSEGPRRGGQMRV
jgi:4,5-dihydroxyphthalate decarboxylase